MTQDTYHEVMFLIQNFAQEAQELAKKAMGFKELGEDSLSEGLMERAYDIEDRRMAVINWYVSVLSKKYQPEFSKFLKEGDARFKSAETTTLNEKLNELRERNRRDSDAKLAASINASKKGNRKR